MALNEFPDFIRKNPEVAFPFPGVRGWMIKSGCQQTVFVEFTETVEVPEHAHADQWEMVIAGKAELHRCGRTEVSGPGDNFFVPAGQLHSATVHAGYKAVIVFDAPDRYQAKEGA